MDIVTGPAVDIVIVGIILLTVVGWWGYWSNLKYAFTRA